MNERQRRMANMFRPATPEELERLRGNPMMDFRQDQDLVFPAGEPQPGTGDNSVNAAPAALEAKSDS